MEMVICTGQARLVVGRTAGGNKGDLFQKSLDIGGICPLRSPYDLVVTSV